MKSLKLWMIGLVVVTMLFQSCNNDGPYGGYKWLVGIATLKPLAEDDFYLQLDDTTTMKAIDNFKPFFRTDFERRVSLSFNFVDEEIPGYSKAAKVYLMDTILTKSVAPDLQTENDYVYGHDPLELIKGWVWCEDGYLNVRFTAWFGGNHNIKHFINLVRTSDPYVYELRHNAYNDMKTYRGDGLVAFRIKDEIESFGEPSVITIRYLSDFGMCEVKVNYAASVSGADKPKVINGIYEKVN